MPEPLLPPRAARRPHVITQHGQTRVDDYYWLREREDPEVLRYLEAENAYTEAQLAPTQPLQAALFQEMRGRLVEDDTTAPVRRGAHWYYRRSLAGRQYADYCRKRGSLAAPEEVLLDVNALAAGHAQCEVGAVEISPDERWLACAVDFDGSEIYTVRFKDLESGAWLPETLANVFANRYDRSGLVWANDNATLYYTTLDAAHRPHRVHRHTRGADPAADALLYEEPDEAFSAYLQKTRSQAYVLLNLHSNITTETRFAPADGPAAEFRLVAARRRGVEYTVAHHADRFLILTNDQAQNFRLVEAPVAAPGADHWRELVPGRAEVFLEGLDVFRRHLALYERAEGLRRIRLSDPDAVTRVRSVAFPEPVYTFWPIDNVDDDAPALRFLYSSLVTPNTVVDYGLDDDAWNIRKQDQIPSGYDPLRYASERAHAAAPDGALVPISLVYRKDFVRDRRGPLVLFGYGAYGAPMEPAFNSQRLSLLDRGFVIALAHVRGGSELGRAWYEAGKLRHKRNTFTDFCACAEHLIAQGYTSSERLAIVGRSAGGLLIGAVVTQRPELFGCAVAHVPFVDVLTTMSDPSIPLTVVEWDEWGNPNDPDDFAYMQTYSPYDQIQARAYPPLLVTAGLNDPRVAYWEPAKFVARLRAMQTGDQRLLLRTHLGAGHAGSSGRYDSLKETALEYAFILDTVGRPRA